MASSIHFLFLYLLFLNFDQSLSLDFIFNGGFRQASSNISLNGAASITRNGALQLTNHSQNLIGHAFYGSPINMLNHESGLVSDSFSTTFVFAIVNRYADNGGGHGLAFTVSPSKELDGALPGQFLGILGDKNNGLPSSHVFAVEFDTVRGLGFFGDINDNHVGIDINSVKSTASEPACYYVNNTTKKKDLELESGESIQAWIEYDGVQKVLNVTISPLSVPKPSQPLLSHPIDLSLALEESMYVGFSASTGKLSSSHYILGWSFRTNGEAQQLELSQLPSPPQEGRTSKSKHKAVMIGVVTAVVILLFIVAAITTSLYLFHRSKYAEILEDWESSLPHRIPFKDLYEATKGFKESMILGSGGLGRTYKGVLPTTGAQVVIKKISHNSRQWFKEFVPEISRLGYLRHRHLVHLLGWCKRKRHLYVVWDFMSNGTLADLLYNQEKKPHVLNWEQRFRVLKSVASALHYLHEGWEQAVIHRDIKPSNVFLDDEMKVRLGDFGLAKPCEYAKSPYNAHIGGTLGYIAPELALTGMASASTDVFAYGGLLLEVACGRRPVSQTVFAGKSILLDWVRECSKSGRILDAADPKLENSFVREEMELVLMLGLLCSQSTPERRPTMRQVMRYLNGDDSLPGDQKHLHLSL